MNIISKKERTKNKKFKKIISYYKNKSIDKPEDFAVEEKFCLNEKSKALYEKIYQKEYNINLEGNIPYEDTVNNFKKIKEYENPFDKLLLTNKLSKIIADDIFFHIKL